MNGENFIIIFSKDIYLNKILNFKFYIFDDLYNNVFLFSYYIDNSFIWTKMKEYFVVINFGPKNTSSGTWLSDVNKVSLLIFFYLSVIDQLIKFIFFNKKFNLT